MKEIKDPIFFLERVLLSIYIALLSLGIGYFLVDTLKNQLCRKGLILVVYIVVNIFSSSAACLFILLIGIFGVQIVAQWVKNLTRNHEVSGSIPGLSQWFKNPALP